MSLLLDLFALVDFSNRSGDKSITDDVSELFLTGLFTFYWVLEEGFLRALIKDAQTHVRVVACEITLFVNAVYHLFRFNG